MAKRTIPTYLLLYLIMTASECSCSVRIVTDSHVSFESLLPILDSYADCVCPKYDSLSSTKRIFTSNILFTSYHLSVHLFEVTYLFRLKHLKWQEAYSPWNSTGLVTPCQPRAQPSGRYCRQILRTSNGKMMQHGF